MVSAAATRTFRRAGILWLAAIGAWYAWTAVSSIRHPLNAGSDAKWAIAILLSCAAAAAWHVLWRDRRAAVIWWALLGLAAAAMAVASGQVRPVASLLWILAIAVAAGARVLRLLGAPLPGRVAESAVFALPSGILLLALVSLLLAVAGLLAPAWILAVLAVLTLLEAPALRRFLREPAVRPPRPAWSAERGALLAVCGVIGLVNLAWALAPEIQYDALNYHLAVPRAFLESRRAVDLPHFWHSYFAQMMESLFAVCLAVGGPVAAKLMSFAVGIGAALGVSALGRLLFGDRAGLWAGALFYVTPMTAWLSTTTYTDHATALFLTASLLAFLHWRRSAGSGWLHAFGWLAGGALAVKATAAYGLVVLGAVLLFDFFRGRARLSALARCAVLAAAAAVPWYALRWAFTGNPFFPLWNALFPGARAVPAGFDAVSVIGEGYGKTGWGWKSLFDVPFRLTFETDRFGEPYPAGAMGIALAVAIPLALVLLARRGERRGETLLALAVFAGSLAAWDLSFRGLRHGFPLLPLAAVLAVGAVETLSAAGKGRSFPYGVLAAMLAAQAVLVPVLFWNIPERVPFRRALGREGEEEFLSRALPAYPAVAYLNKTAAPDEKILGVAAANLRFYLRPRVDTVGETWELQDAVRDLADGELAGKLSSMGYRRIFLAGVQPAVQPGYPFLDPAFLASHAELEFEAGAARVYRLRN